MAIMREYGLMFRLPSLQSFVTGIIILSAGALAYWLHDRMLVMIVGTLSWWLGGMAFAWVGMTVMYYWLTVAYIKHEAWHRMYDDNGGKEQHPEPPVITGYLSAIELARLDRIKAKRPWWYSVNVGLFQDIGISEERLARMAYQLRSEGKAFRHEDFAKKWQGFTRPEWENLTDLMMRRTYARWQQPDHHQSGMQITEAGAIFLAALVDYSPVNKKGVKECTIPMHERVRTDVYSPFFSAGA